MRNYFIKYTIASCLTLFALSTFGQGLQLATMSDIGQVNLTNPANMPNKRFYLNLSSPFVSMGTNISGAKVYQISNGLIPGFIDLDALTEENSFDINGSNPIGFGFKKDKWAFNAHYSPTLNSQLSFNQDFFGFLTQGNAAYTGQTLNLDPNLDLTLYQEFGFGVSREILGIFNVGVRGKFLSGITNIGTLQSSLALTTSDDIYQLDAAANYQLRVSGLPQINTLDDLSNIDSTVINSIGLSGNSGFAFDIGATMNVGEILHLGVSILDIGSINWTNNSYQYGLSSEFSFEGVDAMDFLSGNNSSSILDTLNLDNLVDVSSTSTSYTTSLNTKTYITARLKLGETLYVNGVLRNEFTPSGIRTGFGVGAQKQFGKILNVGAMYSIQNNSFANIGANLVLKLGPAQVFVITDNLLPLTNPWQLSNTNVRLGANITLNDKKEDGN